MRIGIYNEPAGGGVGGSEYVVGVLAHALASGHSVDILHHRQEMTRERLQDFSGLDLAGVNFHLVDKQPFRRTSRHESERWNAALSQPYDAFVNVCHWMPPFCFSPNGVLLVLFPVYRRTLDWPWSESPRHSLDLWRHARLAGYEREWRRRLASYKAIVSISEFTRTWTRAYWGTDSTVIYPPVAMRNACRAKRDTIVSVGRFSTSGHAKRHPELIRAIAALDDVRAAGWTYEVIGGVGNSEADLGYFKDVQALARASGAIVRANISRHELDASYEHAKVFVHAAGLNDPDDKPEMAEHFGIATVEAMSAGCVPVVIDKGAQPEIVEHGVSGFVWKTIEDMQRYLRLLTQDEPLRQRMAVAAERRAQTFSKETFVERMTDVMGLSSPSAARRSHRPSAIG